VKLLAIGRPRSGIDARSEIVAHGREELEALWTMYRDGPVREMYSPGGPGAVLILEQDSADDAIAALAALPLVSNGIIDFELIELRPFGAFQMLFSETGRS
jgi:hypothetical protein